MSQIGAGAVPGEEALRQVGDLRQSGAVLVEELYDGFAIVVLRRVTVLRAEAVVDRDDNGGEPATKPPANGVVGKGSRGEESKATAVEENNDRKRGCTGGDGGGGSKDAEPEISSGVDGNVFGGNAVDGGGVRLNFAVKKIEETAINGAVRATRGVR